MKESNTDNPANMSRKSVMIENVRCVVLQDQSNLEVDASLNCKPEVTIKKQR